MGMFVNPDNSAFQRALNSKIYVDKTGLLEELNAFIDTEQCCVCNSRPRRFGKSITANMLTAYYSRGCDSRELFAGKKISETRQFVSTTQYNDENSLSSVLTIAYLSAMQYYFMPVRELPTGRASAAIQQMKEKNYVQAVANYTGNILLVGIAYDKKTKVHTCEIEEYCKFYS